MVFLVLGIKSLEFEVLKRVVISPEVRNFSSSPHPNTVNFVVSFLTVDTIGGKAVLSESVIQVSKVTVLQVASKIANNTLTFVLNVIDFPDGPSFMIELGPELLKLGLHVGSVEELSLPVVDVEAGFGELVQGVGFLLFDESFIFFLFFLFLRSFLLLGFFLLLFFFFLAFTFLLIVLFGFLLDFFLLLSSFKGRKSFLDAKPDLSEEFTDLLVLGVESFVPGNNLGETSSDFLVNPESQAESDAGEKSNISNGKFISSNVGGLAELSFNNLEGFQVVFLASFVHLLGDGEESKSSVEDSRVVGSELSVVEFKPLIDGGGLSGSLSVELSSLSSKVSEDGT